MNRSETITRGRALPYIAMLFGAILTVMTLPAYGQQEVDPTWYDPWVAPNATVANPAQSTAVVQSSQSLAATNQDRQTVMFMLPAQAPKVRVKDARLDHSRHNAAHKIGGTTSAGSPSIGG